MKELLIGVDWFACKEVQGTNFLYTTRGLPREKMRSQNYKFIQTCLAPLYSAAINDLRGQNWGTYDSVTKLVSQLGLVPAKVYPW